MLPVEAHSTAFCPRATASVTAMVMPRSLNEPVGLRPSTFRCTVQPVFSDSRGAGHQRGAALQQRHRRPVRGHRQPVPVGLDQAGPGGVARRRRSSCSFAGSLQAQHAGDLSTTSRPASAATVSDSAASVARWVTTTIGRRMAALVDDALLANLGDADLALAEFGCHRGQYARAVLDRHADVVAGRDHAHRVRSAAGRTSTRAGRVRPGPGCGRPSPHRPSPPTRSGCRRRPGRRTSAGRPPRLPPPRR